MHKCQVRNPIFLAKKLVKKVKNYQQISGKSYFKLINVSSDLTLDLDFCTRDRT